MTPKKATPKKDPNAEALAAIEPIVAAALVPVENETARFNMGLRQMAAARAKLVRKNVQAAALMGLAANDSQAYAEALDALGLTGVLPDLQPALGATAALETRVAALEANMDAVHDAFENWANDGDITHLINVARNLGW